MDSKNLKAQMVEPINCSTRQDLPTEMVELSEKDLQHIVGGRQLEVASSCFACSTPCSKGLSSI
jgi:bacteriocin-like protein